MHGDELIPVSVAMPEDVCCLHRALTGIANGTEQINVDNCGTAMRFLTAYCAQKEGLSIILTGSPRMQKRPIGGLVDALRELGADITYMAKEGFPPLQIAGKRLAKKRVFLSRPLSTQFVSALLLIGVEADTDISSPYIEMTRQMIARAQKGLALEMEQDWSSAAFWYEWVALHGGELRLLGLRQDTLQGDREVANIFAHLGVATTFTDEGIIIRHTAQIDSELSVNFAATPDLYPAVAIACEKLGVRLIAMGTESLIIKESDRLAAVADHRTEGDHRMAMALLAADLPCDDTACINKSYPLFMSELCRLKG